MRPVRGRVHRQQLGFQSFACSVDYLDLLSLAGKLYAQTSTTSVRGQERELKHSPPARRHPVC